MLIKPLRAEDEADFKAFLSGSAAADSYFRVFHLTRELPHSQLKRFTQIDDDREMALIAVYRGELVAEVWAVTEPGNPRAEFFVLARPNWSETGLPRVLLSRLIAYCRERGTAQLFGDVLPGNQRMLDVAAELGFRNPPMPGERSG